MIGDRNYRFIRDCYRKAEKFIFHWYELLPDAYDLVADDVHEITGHLLRCTVNVYSDADDIGNLVFVFTESASVFKEPLIEVFQRL